MTWVDWFLQERGESVRGFSGIVENLALVLLLYLCLMNSIDFKQKRFVRIPSQCEELFNQTNAS
jgi:hypothetical protein